MTVRDTGARPGAGLARRHPGCPATTGKPPGRLKGFARIVAAPGAGRRVAFVPMPAAMPVWDDRRHAAIRPAGEYRVPAGASPAEPRTPGDAG